MSSMKASKQVQNQVKNSDTEELSVAKKYVKTYVTGKVVFLQSKTQSETAAATSKKTNTIASSSRVRGNILSTVELSSPFQEPKKLETPVVLPFLGIAGHIQHIASTVSKLHNENQNKVKTGVVAFLAKALGEDSPLLISYRNVQQGESVESKLAGVSVLVNDRLERSLVPKYAQEGLTDGISNDDLQVYASKMVKLYEIGLDIYNRFGGSADESASNSLEIVRNYMSARELEVHIRSLGLTRMSAAEWVSRKGFTSEERAEKKLKPENILKLAKLLGVLPAISFRPAAVEKAFQVDSSTSAGLDSIFQLYQVLDLKLGNEPEGEDEKAKTTTRTKRAGRNVSIKDTLHNHLKRYINSAEKEGNTVWDQLVDGTRSLDITKYNSETKSGITLHPRSTNFVRLVPSAILSNPEQTKQQLLQDDVQTDVLVKTFVSFLRVPSTPSSKQQDYRPKTTANLSTILFDLGVSEETVRRTMASINVSQGVSLEDQLRDL